MHMRVEKEKVKVWIYLRNYRLQGYIHIMQGSRLTDSLTAQSRKSDFLPVTDCEIHFPGGQTKKVEFLLVQISSIDMIHEEKE